MTTKQKSIEHDAVPAEFIINDVDLPGVFQDLRGLLAAAGIDTSGADRLVRVLRPAAWKLHLTGGGATADREHLARLRLQLQETEARAADLKARGHREAAESMRAGLASIDESIARHEALVSAAGDAASHDQVAKRARFESARRRVADLSAELDRYRTARIMSAERTALEDRLLLAEREETEAAGAWDSGRRAFEALGVEVRDLTAKVYAAIVAAGETSCVQIGKEARRLCLKDEALYTRFPDRAPNEVIGLYGRAERISGLMDRLGATVRRGMAAFAKACGDLDVIVSGKVKAGPGLEMRPKIDAAVPQEAAV